MRFFIFASLGLAFLLGCSGPDLPSEPVDRIASDLGRVAVQLIVSRGEAQPKVRSQALFVRWRGVDSGTVGTLLAVPGFGADELRPGECRTYNQAGAMNEAARGRTDIQLLDAGPIAIRAGRSEWLLEPHRYPDLLPSVSGFHYSQSGNLAAPGPTAEVFVHGTGGEEVGNFRAQSPIPSAPALESVGGRQPAQDMELRRGTDIAVESSGGDETYVELQTRPSEGSLTVRCRPARGSVILPGSATLQWKPSEAILAASHALRVPLGAGAQLAQGEFWVESRDEISVFLQ